MRSNSLLGLLIGGSACALACGGGESPANDDSAGALTNVASCQVMATFDAEREESFKTATSIDATTLAITTSVPSNVTSPHVYFTDLQGTVKSKFTKPKAEGYGAPVVPLKGGLAVAIEYNGGLSFLKTDATEVASFALDGRTSAKPGVLSDGTVVAGTDHGVVQWVKPDGTQKAKFDAKQAANPRPTIFMNGPAVLADDTTVIGSGQPGILYFLKPDGTEKTRVDLSGYFDSVVVQKLDSGNVAVSMSAGGKNPPNRTMILDPSGKKLKEFPVASTFLTDDLAVGSKGTELLVMDGSGNVKHKVSPGGAVVWSTALLLDKDTIIAEAHVVTGDEPRTLYILNTDGTVRSQEPSLGTPVAVIDGATFVSADPLRGAHIQHCK